MGRRGKPRKDGDRWPCGKLKSSTLDQIKDADRAANVEEMVQVANQPHRRGSFEKWEASAIGRFVKAHRLRSEVYDAAEDYAQLVRGWRAAKGVPTNVRGHYGTGAGPSDETVQSWEVQLFRIEMSITQAGESRKFMHAGYLAMRDLVLDDHDIDSSRWAQAIAALGELAVLMGRLQKGGHPFLSL